VIRSLQFSTVVELIDWVDAMSHVNYLMTAAHSKELPEAYRTVYEEVFDLLTTEMLVNPAPITLPRLLLMVEILREKLKNRDLLRSRQCRHASSNPASPVNSHFCVPQAAAR